VPEQVAKAVTESVRIPVIGIGAGPHTDGQVLVYHDILGILHHPHYEKHIPSFCKRYSTLGSNIHHALSQYRSEVLSGDFPSAEFSPYKMSEGETIKFEKMLAVDRARLEKESQLVEKKLRENDEYESVNLY
jgi:3-methyl-2-oxobutanoate hydroxymethyltransferase